MVVTNALKVVCMKDDRKNCTLGQLCQSSGWKKQDLVEKLEEKRRERSKKYYTKKVAKESARKKALNLPDVKKISAELAKFGY